MPISEERLPFLHPNVDISDLCPENHKLLSSLEIIQYQSVFAYHPDGRYRKSDPKVRGKYGIIKSGKNLFAVYKGKRDDKQIFFSGHKKVKLAQNLLTGDWYALKIISCPMPPLLETNGQYGINWEAIKAKYTNIHHHEVDVLNKYGKPKLYAESGLMQRISTKKNPRAPEYSLQKITYSFLMPLLPGLSLSRFLKGNYKLPTYRWLEIAMKILLEIRQNYHARGLLHRDIKINNIMYNFLNHDVTMIDLEFTRMMNARRQYRGQLSGTLLYMAPEILKQFRSAYNKAIQNDYLYDEYTEAYALGITLKIIFNIPVRIVQSLENIEIEAARKQNALRQPEVKAEENKSAELPEYYQIGYPKEINSIPAISKLLDSLTTANHENRNLSMSRPDNQTMLFDHIIDYLKPIQTELLKATCFNTAIIELNEFYHFWQSALPLHKERFLFALQQYDEICLVTVGFQHDDYYLPLVNMQRILSHESLPYKLICYRKLLVLSDMNSISEIPAYFQQREIATPSRNFTYLYLSNQPLPSACKAFIENGVNIIIADESKSNQDFLNEISAGLTRINNVDCAYVMRAIELECQRLGVKYNLDHYRLHEKNKLSSNPSTDLVRADYRQDKLKNILDTLLRMRNVTISYAAVTMLISIMRNDVNFYTASTSFFSRKARCVANVDKIQVELERRRAPQRN